MIHYVHAISILEIVDKIKQLAICLYIEMAAQQEE